MAAGKLLRKAFSFLSPQSSPLPIPHLRRLSTETTGDGDLKPTPENSVSVLHFLRSRGLGDDVLAGFTPRLLDSKVGKVLPAKFDHLLASGFSGPEAANLLRISGLNVSLTSLRRCLNALRNIVSDDADLPRIMNRASWTLFTFAIIQRMVDNVSKLRGWGVSDAKIQSWLVRKPRFFQLKPQCIDDMADRAEAEYGLRRDSKNFIVALNVLYGMSESTRQSKFRVFESFGWERSGINSLFKTLPDCFGLAEATLVKKLGFLTNEVGYNPSYITKCPAMLSYCLEKRVRPRFELVNALKSKNLLPSDICFYRTWSISEKEFMDKFVIKFMKEEPAICSAYINTMASSKQQPSG